MSAARSFFQVYVFAENFEIMAYDVQKESHFLKL